MYKNTNFFNLGMTPLLLLMPLNSPVEVPSVWMLHPVSWLVWKMTILVFLWVKVS